MATSYTKTNWQDAPSTATPITAAQLNRMEKGIEDCSGQGNANELAIAANGAAIQAVATDKQDKFATIEDTANPYLILNFDSDGYAQTNLNINYPIIKDTSSVDKVKIDSKNFSIGETATGGVEFKAGSNNGDSFKITTGIMTDSAIPTIQFAPAINGSNDTGVVRLTGIAAPTVDNDATNKKYVDDTTNNVKSYANNNFANALKGSASGEAVRLNDVSPIEHTLGVKVSGKNLLPNPNVHAYNYSLDYKKYNNTDEIFLTAGTYSMSASANCPVLQFWNKETKQQYTVDEAVSAYSTNTYYKTYGGYALGRASDAVKQMWFTLKINALITLNSGNSEAISQKCQIEKGSVANPYTPYISLTTVSVTRYGTVESDSPQTYTPAADGTVSGVKSLYPTTTLMTDTEGVIIEAEYNRDINKAFAELQQAVLSMGGNT